MLKCVKQMMIKVWHMIKMENKQIIKLINNLINIKKCNKKWMIILDIQYMMHLNKLIHKS